MVGMAPPSNKNTKKKRPTRTGVPIHAWIDEDLRDAMQDFIDAQEFPPKIVDVVSLLIREGLTKRGFYPRKPKPKS